jgi:hypothetical protein
MIAIVVIAVAARARRCRCRILRRGFVLDIESDARHQGIALMPVIGSGDIEGAG